MPTQYPMWSGAFWSANERERREQQRLDKELERELVRMAAQAGYSKEQAREIAGMQIEGAKERQLMENEARLAGENLQATAAGNRQKVGLAAQEETEKRTRSDALERFILENSVAREMAAGQNAAALAREQARARGDIDRDAAAWERERGYKERMAKAAESEAAARRYNAAAQWMDATGEPLTDEDRTILGLPRPQTGTLGAPTGQRTPAAGPDRISLKPTKPGETPRNPDSAARPIPATPAAAPSAVVRSNDVPSIGTAPAEMPGTNAPVTWRDISLHPTSWDPEGRRKNSALIEQFLQQLDTGRTSRIAPKL